MENPQKRGRQYYDERRRLLKQCLGYNTKQREVPFEIWQDIIKNGDLKVILLCTQLSKGFKILVESVNSMDLVMRYKRIDQIQISLKYLKMLCNGNHPEALMHLGMAHWNGGWGVKKDDKKASEYFYESASLGNCVAMILYAQCVLEGPFRSNLRVVQGGDIDLANRYIDYVSKSDDKLALGFYYDLIRDDDEEAYDMYEHSTIKDNNEYAPYWLGDMFGNKEESLCWTKLSAERGYGPAMCDMYDMLDDGDSMKTYWRKKAELQGHIFKNI